MSKQTQRDTDIKWLQKQIQALIQIAGTAMSNEDMATSVHAACLDGKGSDLTDEVLKQLREAKEPK